MKFNLFAPENAELLNDLKQQYGWTDADVEQLKAKSVAAQEKLNKMLGHTPT